jgi:hypothetical protein
MDRRIREAAPQQRHLRFNALASDALLARAEKLLLRRLIKEIRNQTCSIFP